MQKRGQVTIIVIVGVVILFAFAFVYLLKEGYIEKVVQTGDVSKRLELVFDSIKQEQIYPCVNEETKKAVRLIGNNGGYLTSVDNIQFYGQKFTVLCKPVKDNKNKCAREALSISDLQIRLEKYLDEQIANCIDLSVYREQDYELNAGELKTTVKINPSNIIVNVNYPVSVQKGAVNFNASEYIVRINAPFLEMGYVTNEILNAEADNGYFPAYLYSMLSKNYDIRKYIQYPNKFYVIRDLRDNYVFRFAVQNEK